MIEQALERNGTYSENKKANSRNFFQNNRSTLIALSIIAAISGAAFAIFYFGVVSVAAAVTFLGKFGLPLEALNSMSTLAASGILAGISAGFTSVVTATTYAVSSGFSALFNLFNKSTSKKGSTDTSEATQKITDNNSADEDLKTTNPALKTLSANSQGNTEQNSHDHSHDHSHDNAPSMDSPTTTKKVTKDEESEDNDVDQTSTVGMGNN